MTAPIQENLPNNNICYRCYYPVWVYHRNNELVAVVVLWECAATRVASYPHFHSVGRDFSRHAGGGRGGHQVGWRPAGGVALWVCGLACQSHPSLKCRPRHLHHPTGPPGWCRSFAIVALVDKTRRMTKEAHDHLARRMSCKAVATIRSRVALPLSPGFLPLAGPGLSHSPCQNQSE